MGVVYKAWDLHLERFVAINAINRIVLDLSNVTHINNVGLEALLGIWTAKEKAATWRSSILALKRYGARS